MSRTVLWSIPEADDLSGDVRRLLDELEYAPARPGHGGPLHAPPLDVVERPDAIDVVLDLPGVMPSDLKVVFKHGVLIVVGEKHPPEGMCHEGAAFHLVERSFGRFARVVRFEHAVDATRARGVFAGGVLRISVPRLVERRGREIAVPVDAS